MDIEFFRFIQVHQEVGRRKPEDALPPIDFFTGGKHHRHSAENIDAAPEEAPLHQGRDEQQEARQEKPDRGEILHPVVFPGQRLECQRVGNEERAEETYVQTQTEVTKDTNRAVEALCGGGGSYALLTVFAADSGSRDCEGWKNQGNDVVVDRIGPGRALRAPRSGTSHTNTATKTAKPPISPANDGQTRPTAAGSAVKRGNAVQGEGAENHDQQEGAAPENSSPRRSQAMG